MTSEQQGFMFKILSEPDCDAHRLVYADWLDENGEPDRAEFIRVQVELSRLPLPFVSDAHPLRRRERELHPQGSRDDVAFGELMGADIKPDKWYSGPPRIRWEYRLGFPTELTCSAEDWLRHANTVFWHPEQRVGCVCCKGTGRRDFFSARCYVCGNLGTRPRPFVPTAQPIRRVTITGHDSNWGGNPVAVSELGFTDDRWPGVTFTVQPTETRTSRSGYMRAAT